jgi:sulfate adenylyltransferase
MIRPHGGTLINKELPNFEKKRIIREINEFEKKIVPPQTIKVIKNISLGVFSPLEGFMNKNNYKLVLEHMYLENNLAWPFPITLDASKEELKNLKADDQLILTDLNDTPIALMNIEISLIMIRKNMQKKHMGHWIETTLELKTYSIIKKNL